MRTPSDPPTTLALTDGRATDPQVTGYKAATLARLLREGFPCADGVVIPTWIHRRHQADTATDPRGRVGHLAHLERVLVEITDLHPTESLAVRSSGTTEDTAEASCAGLHTSVLDVTGTDALRTAVLECWASAENPARIRYAGAVGAPAMAVLVQRMLEPEAAGAAFATGSEGSGPAVVSVSAVRGRADRLMQGETPADEWTVTGTHADRLRSTCAVITFEQAVAVAELTRRVSAALSCRAEIEWALCDGDITLLQARPVTHVDAAEPTWSVPARGEWRRDIRLGEWLPEPVTPLFATWFLPAVDLRFRRAQWRRSGVLVSTPSYRIVNGWYYHSPLGERRSAALVEGMLVNPRFACAMLAGRHRPAVADRLVIAEETAALEHHTRRYRELLGSVTDGFESMPELAVAEFVDRVVAVVGDYLWPMLLVGGAAWRAEQALARYYLRRLHPSLGAPYQELLVQRGRCEPVPAHAVSTLDWYRPTLGEVAEAPDLPAPAPMARATGALRLEQACLSVLLQHNTDPGPFQRLLSLARDSASRRRLHTGKLTEPWPVLRRALHRLGTALVDQGVIDSPEDVHFLTLPELRTALSTGSGTSLRDAVADRVSAWTRQRALRPPLALGTAACLLPLLLGRPATASTTDGDVLHGVGVSPGRATGRARIVEHPETARMAAGDILVVRSLVPALAPQIMCAAAVAADVGSVAAHMSVIAREYGVPAVVALHSVTRSIRDGDVITVDGTTGRVHRRGAVG
ncbi:PEP/pyruvate-binding domain-containing protein [Streptomyces sp. NPDC015684]|uniref:PEP/pyruvate-binding domain-containing protein n=1 Tax=Streptomyces sp. NPDC015684 TaxID=3364963 RepID=UPI0036F93341